VGQITAVDLGPAGPGGVSIPVRAEFERALLRDLAGPAAASGEPLVPWLVARGLVAQLATQSVLTGQLYVDLDLDATRAAPANTSATGSASAPAGSIASARASAPANAGAGALPVIPTAPSTIQSLQAQLQGVDLAQIGRDLSALTASMRQLFGGPEPARALGRVADAAQALQRLAERLEREVVPLSRTAQAALGEGQRAASAVGQGAQQLSQLALAAQQASVQVATAASQAQGQIGALGSSGTAALAQMQRAAEAVQQAAEALRAAAAGDSSLRLNADRAFADISNAARSLRELAELLERHPEALLRGRGSPPP
jgi:paraquat-inducible protein B